MAIPEMDLKLLDAGPDGWAGYGSSTPTTRLKPCPFCGSTDVKAGNTHTPYYQVECGLCEAHGPLGQPDIYNGRPIKGRETAERVHHEAFSNAVNLWNERS
jgi:Lar family restriction alleviation protein